MISNRKFKMAKTLRYCFYNLFLTFKSEFAYKAATFLGTLTQLILLIAMAALWKAIYKNEFLLGNYDLNDMLSYWIISISLSQLYPYGVSKTFGHMVKSGKIVTSLLNPIPMEWQLFSTAIGITVYKFVFNAFPLFIFGRLLYKFEITISMINILFTLSVFLIAYLFVFALELLIGSLSYYTQSLWGIENFKISIVSFLSGKLLPISLYPTLLQNILKIMPFASIYYIPTNLLLGKSDQIEILSFLITICMTVIMFLMYFIISKLTIRKLMIQGG